MFGGPLPYPKEPKPRPKNRQPDILNPHPHEEGGYAHRGRAPNTDYAGKMLHYKQRESELHEKRNNEFKKQVALDSMYIRYQDHAVNKRFRAKIQERLNEKLRNYEQEVEARRDRLRNMLGDEERAYVRETVEMLQKADDSKIVDMKNKCEALRAAKEAERQDIVRQKRIQQYADRSMELRPFVVQRRREETKLTQLQQMRENEARREAEKELDKMWEEISKRHDQAFFEREMQEALIKYERCRKDKEILALQIRAKKVMEEELKAVELENRKETERLLKAQAAQEEEDRAIARQKRIKEAEELKEQIRIQQQFEAQRKKEEKALDDAFRLLGELEVKREQEKNLNESTKMRHEVAVYRQHLKELEAQRKDEDAKLEAILSKYREEEVERFEEKMCKRQQASDNLKKSVLTERAKQVEYKRLQAEKDLDLKKQENALLRNVIETNKKLNEETARLAKEAAKQYRNDLKKQIDYNHQLREKEVEELERQLEVGMAEERKYQAIIQEVLYGKQYYALAQRHPFRQVLDKYDCHCPGGQDPLCGKQ